MARYPAGGQLPPIHWDDRDSPNHPRQATNRQTYFSSHGSPQLDESPHHAALVSRAILLEQDFTNNSYQAHPGGVLQDYIHTLTMSIKKISKDIEVIEEKLHNRERASEHTSNTVKSLEMQHVGSVTDLRQRVGRCDVSIAKLSGDSRRISESLTAFNKQLQENNSRHNTVIGDLETKISKLESRLSKYTSEQHSKVNSVESDSKHTVTLLETKLGNRLEELQRTLDTLSTRRDSDWQLLERGLTTMIESTISKRGVKQDLFERKTLDRLEELEKKLIQQDGTIRAKSDELSAGLHDSLRKLETSLRQKQEALENEVKRDLKEMTEQREQGFKRVKDSMSTMRIILEGKQQLLADNLHKQLANVKKLVVIT